MQTDRAFHFRMLETDVMIECPDPRWIGLVRRLWAPFASSHSRHAVPVVIEPIEDGWCLRLPERTSPRFPDPWSLIANLVHELDERALRQASDVQDVHAAVVAWDGVAVVLAGPSGASKTSMALDLLRLGWSYLSDDRALTRRGSGAVMPYPKPAGIKDADQWGRYQGVWDGEDWPSPPTGMFYVPASAVGTVAEEDATPRFIVFPRFQPGASLTFEEITAGRAAALASQYVLSLSPEAVSVLARLCRETRAATLLHGDARAAAELIDRWVKTG